MCIRRVLPALVLLCGIHAAVLVPAMDRVNESARDIPVAYEVDVVVVGGTSGAVSAATAAARGGASVFLAAPLPYLGEDLTGTLQLWLEEGESPSTELARQVYRDIRPDSPDPNACPFTYQTDLPSDSVHKDTSPASRLADGLWSSAARESVQFNGNVTIVADLEKSRPIRKVRLFAYRRPTAGSPGSAFDVERMTVSVSDDQQTWTPLGTVANIQSTGGEDEPAALDCPAQASGRYVRVFVEKPASVARILLGELEIVGTDGGNETARPLAVSPPPDAREENAGRRSTSGWRSVPLQLLRHRRAARRARKTLRDRDGQSRGTPGRARQAHHRRDLPSGCGPDGRREVPSGCLGQRDVSPRGDRRRAQVRRRRGRANGEPRVRILGARSWNTRSPCPPVTAATRPACGPISWRAL